MPVAYCTIQSCVFSLYKECIKVSFLLVYICIISLNTPNWSSEKLNLLKFTKVYDQIYYV